MVGGLQPPPPGATGGNGSGNDPKGKVTGKQKPEPSSDQAALVQQPINENISESSWAEDVVSILLVAAVATYLITRLRRK